MLVFPVVPIFLLLLNCCLEDLEKKIPVTFERKNIVQRTTENKITAQKSRRFLKNTITIRQFEKI